ncbi:Eco57I restriction-modification methylase [Rosistilla carotiformis]|uniref:site-specific DNA-methyltransferase (adenine-specific) n=1 Tax=Rosistilla carotiformis TaxID=2528017 RepID=A0A518JU08_9BACT|nr:BREX-1 system adenine-specific DNA-methyltransferase PglX [Rosistilla carotiformis]QDV69032.1 Eco57I restriction-modification methylase [Rosistilla carotiformis]
METKHLKKYAPEARREFITAVKNKAAVYGLLPKQILPMKEEGDVVIIGDRPFPRSVAKQRKELEDRIKRDGFQQFIEAVAYTWFNRFVAIRYMELHGYLDHGYRVLSHPEGKSAPEILENAERIELPGLNRDSVVDLKLDGGKDEQLYQMLLLAQCNALHKAMPFLFESIKDGTELLLPDNLLHTDSLVRTLVNDIPEEQWENVEIIGWLYQFYISEKKDEVIGKVVKSEDIPAATQLFTPNWIVKYLVQNSLGRKWIATYPDSPLKQQMEFYIEPAEQTPEVRQQLDEITPDSLNPEDLTLLDPACGSGHILVEAYDLFKAIYEERGYRARDIPKLILTKNLFGLEIDGRAAQLASFALMMKARTDDSRAFGRDFQPNVVMIQDSTDLDAKEITEALNQPVLKDQQPPSGELFEEIADDKSPLFSKKHLGVEGNVSQTDIACLIDVFKFGTTYGSLIRVPQELASQLTDLDERIQEVASHGGMFERATANTLSPFLKMARILSSSHDFVAANPPYMGGKGMAPSLKAFAKVEYPRCRPDLYAMFVERAHEMCSPKGHVGYITMHSWMFLPSFQQFRETFLHRATLTTMAHLGARAFSSISGEVVQTTAFSFIPTAIPQYRPSFVDATDGDEDSKVTSLIGRSHLCSHLMQHDFDKIPGTPVAYWVNDSVVESFNFQRLKTLAQIRAGIGTSDNERFLRYWHEVEFDEIGFGCDSIEDSISSNKTWFPYTKGGRSRKWFGNNEFVVKWRNDGEEIKHAVVNNPSDPNTTHWSRRIFNTEYFFLPSLTWSDIGGGELSVRWNDSGYIHDAVGVGAYGITPDRQKLLVLGILNSRISALYTDILCPTLHFKAGQMGEIPIIEPDVDLSASIRKCVEISRDDWNSSEASWGFRRSPLVHGHSTTLASNYQEWVVSQNALISLLVELETAQNEAIIESYGATDLANSTVERDDITLKNPDRGVDMSEFVSYAVGCMMGRYSLDEPGLIYAQSGNEGFDSGKYKTLPADEDGIVPISDTAWFPDDAAKRLEEFIKVAWPKEHLEENLTFVAESLDRKKGETSRECIRRYFATGFFKHHLSMYKKRPIYWLFSSGKQRAFQCLVYLHRYNAGTLSRMRTEYVVPLQGKMNARIEQLESDIPAAGSTSHRKKLEKERDTLIKQREELQTFDEKLRHYADQRIELDLDDGVKVNYGKFGDLLAEVKAITGKK